MQSIDVPMNLTPQCVGLEEMEGSPELLCLRSHASNRIITSSVWL